MAPLFADMTGVGVPEGIAFYKDYYVQRSSWSANSPTGIPEEIRTRFSSTFKRDPDNYIQRGVDNYSLTEVRTFRRPDRIPIMKSDTDHGNCTGFLHSACFKADDLRPLFVFSLIRDPVAKFESGVRQMRVSNNRTKWMNITADEILQQQIAHHQRLVEKQNKGEARVDWDQDLWLDGHLMPATWELSGGLADGQLLHPSWLGKMDGFLERVDWRLGSDSIPRVVTNLLDQVLPKAAHAHSKNVRPNKHGSLDQLSASGIRQMCTSALYKREWQCLGYEAPPGCP